jgi:uncharacterized membrane protein
MRFAVALPWWGYVLAFAAVVACAWLTYARVAVPLSLRQRGLLTLLRTATLVLLVIFLLRPVRLVEAAGARDSIVAILVDVSRSMRLSDDGMPRIERARALVEQLQQQVGADFRTDLLSFGETLTRTTAPQLAADARRSDLSGAVAALGERYRGQRLAGVVVLSDGGDTAPAEGANARTLGVPVFTIGIGSAAPVRDREVLNVTAGQALLSESSVDLSVSAASYGYATAPMQMRLTANGRPIETRQLRPSSDGAPVHEVFTVSPARDTATVYAVEIPVERDELVAENNTRRILVPAQGRRRRVLIMEGAPGFEHTFLKRALMQDPALEVDSSVRKGQNEDGRSTFFIQAAQSRSAALASGYPLKRPELFLYDAIVFGNVADDFFTRDQLQMTADFVAVRGSGLLVLGARSFERAGLVGTPIEEVLPLDVTDRRSGSVRGAAGATPAARAAALTPDGTFHPATRLMLGADDNRKRWAQLPPLASVSPAGAPRPGAQVLAVAGDGAGEIRPLITTQRYGLGRSMVFTGEASWRWRMSLPASDTTYEMVWRQLIRWLASGTTERIEIPPVSVALPGTNEPITVLVRDEDFAPIANAEVSLQVREPGGQERTVPAALADPREGRYSGAVRFEQAGVYTVSASVRRGGQLLGTVERGLLVGGADIEMSEPRLNDAVLRRLAEATGGQYFAAAEAATLPGLLKQGAPGNPPMQMQDLWHHAYSVVVLILLLGGEWAFRRQVGLA